MQIRYRFQSNEWPKQIHVNKHPSHFKAAQSVVAFNIDYFVCLRASTLAIARHCHRTRLAALGLARSRSDIQTSALAQPAGPAEIFVPGFCACASKPKRSASRVCLALSAPFAACDGQQALAARKCQRASTTCHLSGTIRVVQ